MINGTFDISGNNVTYNSPMWYNGALTISGSNVTFNMGPVVSVGNHTGNGSTVRNCDVYYSGTCSGGTFNGTNYNYTPPVQWPTINTVYYSQRYHYRTTTTRELAFSVVSGSGTFSVVGTTIVVVYPQTTGAIIFAENCNLTIRGTVRGRVTIVSSGTAGSTTQGCVTVSQNFRYANGLNVASAQDSIAVIAKNKITFTANNQVVNGLYFVEQGTTNLSGTGTGSFTLTGVRCSGLSSSYSPITYTYDANLMRFPPPGLPEKPVLVMWRVEG
jgi:hypothetical protein